MSFHYKGFTFFMDVLNRCRHLKSLSSRFQSPRILVFFDCKTNFKFIHFNSPEVIILLILLDFASRGVPSFWVRSLSWSHRKHHGFPHRFFNRLWSSRLDPLGTGQGLSPLPSFLLWCGDGFQCLLQVRHSMLLTCPFHCLSILIFSLAVKRGNFLTCFVAFICYRLQSESLVYTSILKKYPYSVLSRQHNEKWD